MTRRSEHRSHHTTASYPSKPLTPHCIKGPPTIVSSQDTQQTVAPTSHSTTGVLDTQQQPVALTQQSKPGILSPVLRCSQLLSPRRNPLSSQPQKEPSAPRPNIAVVVCAVFLLGAGLLVLLAVIRGWRRHHSSVCAEPACKEFVKLIAETVNHSFDPCVNFDAYVCGGWQARRKYSVHAELVSNALDQMTEVVSKDAAVHEAGQNLLQKASLFYRSCDVVWRGERNELPEIRECLRRAGVVWPHRSPSPDVSRTLLSLSLDFDWPVIIRTRPSRQAVYFLLANSFHFVVEEQGRLRGLEGKRRSFEFLRAHFSEGGVETAVTFEEATQLEEAFFRPLDRERADIVVGPLPAGSFDLNKWIQALAKFNVTKPTKFMSTALKYTTKFLDLWKKYGDDKTHAFISWMAARYTSLFANRQLISNYYGTTNQDVIKYKHGRLCYKLLYRFLGDYLFAPYNAQVFQRALRRDVERIVLSIRTEFAARLSSKPPFSNENSSAVQWSSLDTVLSALTRTMPQDDNATSDSNSLLPDMNTSLVRNWEAAWKMSQLNTNISVPRTLGWYAMHKLLSYSHWNGDFVLAPYVLSFPVYHPSLVDAVKYGALGALVAKASADIAIVHYSTNNATASALREALKCANKTGVKDTLSALSDPASMNVLVGAFKAHGSRNTLEGAKRLTAMQLFFLSWCFTRCHGYSEKLGDECNAAVQHVAAFSSTFSCSLGKPLNPEKKCAVF